MHNDRSASPQQLTYLKKTERQDLANDCFWQPTDPRMKIDDKGLCENGENDQSSSSSSGVEYI